MPTQMPKVIAVLNTKGDSGKTTIATNLAHALQRDGTKVLLVDSDPQGSTRDWNAFRCSLADNTMTEFPVHGYGNTLTSRPNQLVNGYLAHLLIAPTSLHPCNAICK